MVTTLNAGEISENHQVGEMRLEKYSIRYRIFLDAPYTPYKARRSLPCDRVYLRPGAVTIGVHRGLPEGRARAPSGGFYHRTRTTEPYRDSCQPIYLEYAFPPHLFGRGEVF